MFAYSNDPPVLLFKSDVKFCPFTKKPPNIPFKVKGSGKKNHHIMLITLMKIACSEVKGHQSLIPFSCFVSH